MALAERCCWCGGDPTTGGHVHQERYSTGSDGETIVNHDDIDVDVLRAIEPSIARAAWWTHPTPNLEQWDPEKRTAYEIERWKAEGFYWWTESVAKPLFRTILAAMHSPAAARPLATLEGGTDGE